MPPALPLLQIERPCTGPHADSVLFLFATHERVLRAIAGEILASRTTDDSELALLSSVEFYCALKQLMLPSSARDAAPHFVATLWRSKELVSAITRTCPPLIPWAEGLCAAVDAAPHDTLHVGMVLGPETVASLAAKILPPINAETEHAP